MPLIRLLLAALMFVLVAACASPATRAQRAARSLPLILVSIDGFRADFLERGLTPTLRALADGGARAEYMRPSFPSLTFPNHYTLITGLRPDRNGIVSNTMEDELIPGERFSASNRVAVSNERWWDEAVPLWTTVQRGGRRAGTMFWPGSEATVHGAHPDYWAPYDPEFSEAARVDTVLGWLDHAPDERPVLLTLYLNSIDTTSHQYGPDSAQANDALRAVDATISRLLAGLDRRGLRERVNLVVVSDHGMASTSPDRVVYLDDLLPEGYARTVMWGVLTGIVPAPEHRAEVERLLFAAQPHMRCQPKAELPARLHYGSNRRIPPILCIAEHGWVIFDHATVARKKHFSLGEHGYDIDHPDMRALFIASGPAFLHKVIVPAFDNVDVYSLLAHLLGEKPEPNDGSIDSLRGTLRDPPR